MRFKILITVPDDYHLAGCDGMYVIVIYCITSHDITAKNSVTFSEQQICNSEAVRSISIPCSQTYGITTEERHFAELAGFS